MTRTLKLMISLLILTSACTDSSTTVTESVEDSSATDAATQVSDPQVLESVGPAIAATEVGAANSGGSPETPQTAGIPEPFEVLFSLFELDGTLAVGFSPFENPGPNCVQSNLTNPNGSLQVFSAAMTDGISCSYAPLVTSATKGELLACADIRFLLTSLSADSLSAANSELFASITSPAVPEGANWIGATFSGPISSTELPELDQAALGCEITKEVSMPPDIPTPNVDGVTQRVSVLEIEGGIQASYTTLGEGPRKEHISQFEIEPWGEVIVDDGKRIELRHEDGRYLAWVSRGGPGPMTIQICIWEQDPPDSTCPAP